MNGPYVISFYGNKDIFVYIVKTAKNGWKGGSLRGATHSRWEAPRLSAGRVLLQTEVGPPGIQPLLRVRA